MRMSDKQIYIPISLSDSDTVISFLKEHNAQWIKTDNRTSPEPERLGGYEMSYRFGAMVSEDGALLYYLRFG